MAKGQKIPRPERKILEQLTSGYTLERERIWPTDVVRFHLRYLPPDGSPGEYLELNPELVRAMVCHGLLREASLDDPDHIRLVPSERGRHILGTGYLIDPEPEPSLFAPDAGQRRRLETD